MFTFARDLESQAPQEADFMITDADCTLFLPGTAELYSSAKKFLDWSSFGAIALVSGNPEQDLARARQAVIGADVVETPQDRKVCFNKADLFQRAISGLFALVPDAETGFVMGNRVIVDVWMGRRALKEAGVPEVNAMLVRHPDGSEVVALAPSLLRDYGDRALQRIGLRAAA